MAASRIHLVRGMSNLGFLARYGKPGCVGLLGGSSAIDRAIRLGQRALDDRKIPSLWSHVVVFQGERADGQSWLLESDIELGKGQVRNGVQENRIDKYSNSTDWPNLAVLDFGLKEREARSVVGAGLDLVARRTTYDLGGILETYWAMMRKTLGSGRKKDATFCSAFVRAIFHHAGVDLAEGIAVPHTMPEHLSRTARIHTRYLLVRDGAPEGAPEDGRGA